MELRPLNPDAGESHPATASDPISSCPSCGQRIDRTNIRCPRCRRWFVAPPVVRGWSRLTIVTVMLGLVLAGFVAGVIMQRIWLPLPPGVDVPEESGGSR